MIHCVEEHASPGRERFWNCKSFGWNTLGSHCHFWALWDSEIFRLSMMCLIWLVLWEQVTQRARTRELRDLVTTLQVLRFRCSVEKFLKTWTLMLCFPKWRINDIGPIAICFKLFLELPNNQVNKDPLGRLIYYQEVSNDTRKFWEHHWNTFSDLRIWNSDLFENLCTVCFVWKFRVRVDFHHFSCWRSL